MPRMIDTNPAGNKIGFVPEEKATRGASRYDAVIATLVGLCAPRVFGYTAYVQSQQVRGAVWPILEFDSSNSPTSTNYACITSMRAKWILLKLALVITPTRSSGGTT